MKLLTTIILLLSFLPSVGNAQIFGPGNYEDCIIEGMQGVSSDVAAVSIRSACREKFPDEQGSGSSPSSIGWEVESDGIGRCHIIWDGAKFIETTGRVTPVNFKKVKIKTPREIKVTFFIPQSFKPNEGEDDLNMIWRLSGHNFDYVYCGK